MTKLLCASIAWGLCAFAALGQADATLVGMWRGTRAEAHPYTGQTYTIDFEFEFRPDGIYVEQARLGQSQILKLEGKYSLQPGGKPGIALFSHTLMLTPLEVLFRPGTEELMLLKTAYLPNVTPTQQYAGFLPNSITLQDRSGGLATWGLQRQASPDVVSLAPINGSGFSITATAVFRNPGGQGQHYLGYMLFLPLPNIVRFNAEGTCLIEYNRLGGRPNGLNPGAKGGIRLINNAGNNWLGPIEGVPVQPGTAALNNNACAVDAANSQVTFAGTDMILSVPVTFNSAAVTSVMGTFIQSNSVTGYWTDFRQFGNWRVPGASSKPGPSAGSVTPSNSIGNGTLTFTGSHTSGASAIGSMHMRIDEKIVGDKPCHVVWFAGGIGLVNEAGAFVSAGLGQPVNTGRCSILAGWTSTTSGNTVTVNVPMTFNPASFGVGTKNVYLNVFDTSGGVSHWVQSGTILTQ